MLIHEALKVDLMFLREHEYPDGAFSLDIPLCPNLKGEGSFTVIRFLNSRTEIGRQQFNISRNVFHHHFRQVISTFTLTVVINDAINVINFQ